MISKTLKYFHLVLAFLGSFGACAVVKIPFTSREKIEQYERENDEKGSGPFRFAETNDVFITPGGRDGAWDKSIHRSDYSLYSVIIESEGAKSLNVGFTLFELPAESLLTFENGSPTTSVHVPSLSFDSNQNSETSQLWTPIMATDRIIINLELWGNTTLADIQIELTSVNVGFREIGGASNNSGDCNVDVVCPEGDGWRPEIRAAAGYSFGGSLFCSGSMINNMESDGTPYFLTARHCGIKRRNAASLVVYWNFETSECGGRPNGRMDQYTSGARFLSSYRRSDSTLLKLNSVPDPAYKVTYAGWDNSPNAYTFSPGVTIHHPSGDEKRISFENDSMSLDGNFVRINDWDLGTTEPGSSGSPLFNGKKRIIGQLQGGAAACGNDLSDWYGHFSTSYEKGNYAQWLDPNNVLGGNYGGVDTYDPLNSLTISMG